MASKKWNKMGAGSRMVKEKINFEQEYSCHFEPSEKDIRLMKIAENYHSRCDMYDAIVCSCLKDGEPCPRTNRELALINKNARNVCKELIEQNLDLSRKEIIKAIQSFGHM